VLLAEVRLEVVEAVEAVEAREEALWRTICLKSE
jgi:hypothetical protein